MSLTFSRTAKKLTGNPEKFGSKAKRLAARVR
jgi:hypothetical protein